MNVINQIKSLLGMEVKLEEITLVDGITVLVADMFEAGAEVFIKTEDDQQIPLPVGSYEDANGYVLVVEQEGIIASYMEAPAAEEEAPMEQPEAEVPVEAEAAPVAKKTIESIVKESHFSSEEVEALKAEIEALKTQLSEATKVEPEAVELEAVTPVTFNPENKSNKVDFKYSQNREMSTLDKVMQKINS